MPDNSGAERAKAIAAKSRKAYLKREEQREKDAEDTRKAQKEQRAARRQSRRR